MQSIVSPLAIQFFPLASHDDLIVDDAVCEEDSLQVVYFMLEELRQVVREIFADLFPAFVGVLYGNRPVAEDLSEEGYVRAEAAVPHFESVRAFFHDPRIDHGNSLLFCFHIDDSLEAADLRAGDRPADPLFSLRVTKGVPQVPDIPVHGVFLEIDALRLFPQQLVSYH
jgi:hypothetical protein